MKMYPWNLQSHFRPVCGGGRVKNWLNLAYVDYGWSHIQKNTDISIFLTYINTIQ